MTVEMLLDNCFARIPWYTLKEILRTKNLPLGKGAVATREKLAKLGQSDHLGKNKINLLEDSFFDHLFFGEKAIRLYQVDDNLFNSLKNAFATAKPEETEFKLDYPYYSNEKKIQEIESNIPFFTAIEKIENGLAAVFSTKRFIFERKELSLEGFAEETRKELNTYDQVIGVKTYTWQFSDMVIFRDSENIVEIRLDLSKDISADDRDLAFKQIRRKFNEMAQNLVGATKPLLDSINLYSVLNRLYCSDDGRVCELAFTTDEASIKHERMRRKDVDLRLETYHLAGRSAVPHINPYRLGVSWDYRVDLEPETKPEILFPGHFRMISSPEPRIENVIVSRCSGAGDYEFVMQKLIGFLNEPAKSE